VAASSSVSPIEFKLKCRLMALRDISPRRNKQVAFGEKRRSSGGQDWLAQSRMTRMYGPAVRCKGISMRRWQAVLHQCIRPLIGALCSGLIMDISAPAFSLADRPQRTIWVTRFRMRREDRTSISFSSSRRPWRVNELLANATRLEAYWPRRCDCEPARSMRRVRACWRARSQARCGGVASWPPRSNA